MHLGKRPRPPPGSAMRRTTSMALLVEKEEQPPEHDPVNGVVGSEQRPVDGVRAFRPSMSMGRVSHFLAPQPEYFLQSCTLCKRLLGHGRDIYMYRGDAAFCSAECRNEQIVIDERLEKCALVMRKKESPSANHHGHRHQNAATANQDTLAAA